MISQIFGLKKISEDEKSIKYIYTRTYWHMLPILLLLLSFILLFINPLFKWLLFFSLALIPLLIIVYLLVFFKLNWAKIRGRQIVWEAIDYKRMKLTILKGNEKGFLKFSVKMDVSALRGNTKGLSKTEKAFADTTSKIFRVK
jgi:hypothetical protein